MKPCIKVGLWILAVGVGWSPPVWAQARQGALPVLRACSLVTKEEVKRHLPWAAMLDQFDPEEDAMGTYGTGCEYPSVRVQVMTFSQGTLDAVKKKDGLETISDVGDEAYLHHNPNGYAELYVKVGARTLTLQASIRTTFDEVKPGVVSLAKALVPKLR